MSEHLDPSLVAIPVYVAAMLWEQRALRAERPRAPPKLGYERRDTIASLGTGLVSVLTVGVLQWGVLALAEALYRHRLFTLGTGLRGWIVGMLAWDFAYYWLHRWEHSVRILWATHVSHHSSQHYNFSTALRQPWGPFFMLVTFPPLALLGLEPWLIASCGGVNLIYQFFVHTEAVDRLPRVIELIFNTPSHHRVHHATNPQYLDKNHGGILIVWDRLFGTFAPEVEPVRYGLTKNLESFNLWTIFVHEYVAIARDVLRAKRWGDRFRHVFADPGWRPSRDEAAPAE